MSLLALLHIPFCRKRCHFCYFRVYTDKNANEVQSYLDVLAREWELYNEQRAIADGRSTRLLRGRHASHFTRRRKSVRGWTP
jgi:coproporphyrinogen III oxidase-like Fe-S oxidoreductase